MEGLFSCRHHYNNVFYGETCPSDLVISRNMQRFKSSKVLSVVRRDDMTELFVRVTIMTCVAGLPKLTWNTWMNSQEEEKEKWTRANKPSEVQFSSFGSSKPWSRGRCRPDGDAANSVTLCYDCKDQTGCANQLFWYHFQHFDSGGAKNCVPKFWSLGKLIQPYSWLITSTSNT